jgi:tight adherence protein B
VIDNYNSYKYSNKERFYYFLKGSLIGIVIGYLFYSSIIISLCMSAFGVYYLHVMKKQLIKARKWQLNLEFRDGLASLSSALNAGYSMENAFAQATRDLRLMYPGKSFIVPEFERITNQININQSIEEIMLCFGDRSDIEDIKNFARVLETAKRTGGDLIRIIRSAEKTITDKIEINREIITLITAKKLESNIMCIIPFGIILYLRLFTDGYLNPLYHNLFGYVFMSILLIFYLFVYTLAQKIVNIEI